MDDPNLTTPQPPVPPVDQTVPPVPPPPPPVIDPAYQTPPVPEPVQQPPVDTPQEVETPAPPTEAAPAPEQPDYITAVGQSMVDLLTDISVSDVRKQKVATEMRITVEQVTTLCNGLLEKIDSQTVSEAELAFLITSPIADSIPSQESTT